MRASARLAEAPEARRRQAVPNPPPRDGLKAVPYRCSVSVPVIGVLQTVPV